MKTNLCFLDDYWLDLRRNVVRQWYSPRLAGTYQDPVYASSTYPSLAWCPEAGLYRLWYEALPQVAVDAVRYMGLAESEDGRNWRPAAYQTAAECNRVAGHFVYAGNGGIHGTSVYRDPYEPDPARLYKSAGMTRTDTINQQPRGCFPLTLSTSADGINWTEQPGCPVYPFTSDTYNRLFYNPVQKKYQLILRASYVDRRICSIESADLKDWSEPRLLLHPGAEYAGDQFAVQLYGMGVFWNEGVFYGLLLRYHTSLVEEDLVKMTGYMDTELVYSYDGHCWLRTSRQPLVEKPASPQFGFNQLAFLDMMQSEDEKELILVASASRSPHLPAADYVRVQKQLQGSLSRFNFYAIRKDGFCALESTGQGGRLITKPFELLAADLTLNLAAASGRVSMAILQADGQPVPGFSFADSLLASVDDVQARPSWRDRQLAELVGQRVRFAFTLDSAALYSLRGSFRPYIFQRQVSLGNPRQLPC